MSLSVFIRTLQLRRPEIPWAWPESVVPSGAAGRGGTAGVRLRGEESTVHQWTAVDGGSLGGLKFVVDREKLGVCEGQSTGGLVDR